MINPRGIQVPALFQKSVEYWRMQRVLVADLSPNVSWTGEFYSLSVVLSLKKISTFPYQFHMFFSQDCRGIFLLYNHWKITLMPQNCLSEPCGKKWRVFQGKCKSSLSSTVTSSWKTSFSKLKLMGWEELGSSEHDSSRTQFRSFFSGNHWTIFKSLNQRICLYELQNGIRFTVHTFLSI